MRFIIELDAYGGVEASECQSTFGGWADEDFLRFLLQGEYTVLPTIVPDLVILCRKTKREDAPMNSIATDLLRRKNRNVYGLAYMLQGNPDGTNLRGMDFNRASHWCCALRGWKGGARENDR